jgi:hypothetical protein
MLRMRRSSLIMYHTVANPSAGRWTLLPGFNICRFVVVLHRWLGQNSFFTEAADDEDRDGQPVIL